MASAEELLTVSELSMHLRVHPTTIYRLLREGQIPGFRVGSAWRCSRAAIDTWKDGQTGPTNSDLLFANKTKRPQGMQGGEKDLDR
jgi:excisionase family DNA binding protein